MEIMDFGRNTFQLEILFRLDIISPDFILDLAKQLMSQSGAFAGAFKEAQSGDSILSRGIGTPESPLLQVRLNSRKLVLWAGWYTTYSTWVKTRNALVEFIAKQSHTEVPSSLLESVISSVWLNIPKERVKKEDERPELASALQRIRRFVPEEFLAGSSTAASFGNLTEKKIVDITYSGNSELKTDTVMFRTRWLEFVHSDTIQTNIAVHAKIFDELFLRYHSAEVVPMVRAQ